MMNDKTVLVLGTFDLLHEGHTFFLQAAKRFGSKLVVVIARDSTVEKVKGRKPVHNEIQRLQTIRNIPMVDEAHLGNVGDKLSIIETIKPDIICLGYDQEHFTHHLKEKLAKRGLFPDIIRITIAHKPEEYKTSIIRKKHNI